MSPLKKLSIKNLKGYGRKTVFTFSQPNGINEGSGMNIIVGPNNSGKSTIITAIEMLKEKSMINKSDRTNSSEKVEILITDSKNNEVIVSNIGLGGPLKQSNKSITEKDFLIIKSRRSWDYKFNGSFNLEGYTQNLRGHSNENQDPYFGSYLNSIFEDRDLKNKLTEFIRKIIPNFYDWKVEYDNSTSFIEYITGKENITHNAGGLSDGVTNLFKIGAFIANIGTSDIETLIIDEPELSLQPSSQKLLFKELLKTSKTKQIIIMTHSPNFIDLDIIENKGQIYRLNKAPGKNVVKKQVKNKTLKLLGGTLTRWNRPFIFDSVAKEFFFENNILFVEGQEDVGLIKRFCKENEIPLNFDIFGYGVDGAGNLEKFLLLAKELGIKGGALFDGDKKKDYEKCRKIYKKGVFLLAKDDIRDKYFQEIMEANIENIGEKIILKGKFKDSKEIEKEGFFKKNGKIKSKNKNDFIKLINEINQYFV